MAYLNKRQYEYREYSAGKKSEENEQVAIENGMNEYQAELISSLCSIRHKIHSNIDRLVKNSSDDEDVRELSSLIEEINDSDMPSLSIDIEDIDDFLVLYEIGDMPDKDSNDYQDWYDAEYRRIYKEWEQVNGMIEEYLRNIDKIYHTNFAPSGALRIY